MIELPPLEITDQVSRARTLIERHLGTTLRAVHLFGSALDGGLKPHSDIDLLVTVDGLQGPSTGQALALDFLTASAPPGTGGTLRPLEVTVVAHGEIVPWRYPARRELQFGEWLRQDLVAGIFEPAVLDHDLAILLTTARQHSMALVGPAADTLFTPVPNGDLYRALAETIAQWNSAPDWEGDERNVVLALARTWYTASTGRIAPKDVASAWVLEGLPAEHRPVLHEARAAYLGLEEDRLASRPDEIAAFVRFARSVIGRLLDVPGNLGPDA